MNTYAFPSGHDPKTGTAQFGMNLRDYFARNFAVGLMTKVNVTNDEEFIQSVCKQSYVWADEMMKAREL